MVLISIREKRIIPAVLADEKVEHKDQARQGE